MVDRWKRKYPALHPLLLRSPIDLRRHGDEAPSEGFPRIRRLRAPFPSRCWLYLKITGKYLAPKAQGLRKKKIQLYKQEAWNLDFSKNSTRKCALFSFWMFLCSLNWYYCFIAMHCNLLRYCVGKLVSMQGSATCAIGRCHSGAIAMPKAAMVWCCGS